MKPVRDRFLTSANGRRLLVEGDLVICRWCLGATSRSYWSARPEDLVTACRRLECQAKDAEYRRELAAREGAGDLVFRDPPPAKVRLPEWSVLQQLIAHPNRWAGKP